MILRELRGVEWSYLSGSADIISRYFRHASEIRSSIVA
jgi:hypothetical protein